MNNINFTVEIYFLKLEAALYHEYDLVRTELWGGFPYLSFNIDITEQSLRS